MRSDLSIQDFQSLNFGEVSAEREVAKDSERFLRTYLDVWRLEEKAKNNEFFLVLGPKGSGKTAVGHYLRLSLERRAGASMVFSTFKNMDELSPNVSPLSALTSKLVSEDAQGVTTAAWRLFIGIEMALLAQKDQGSSLGKNPGFSRLMRELEEAGLAGGDFPRVLRSVRENRLSFSAKFLGSDSSRKQSDELSASILGDRLVDAVIHATTEAHYLLVIDGLDRIISENKAYWLSIASLLMATSDIHNRIIAGRSNARLLVMCRSDVFRKVKFADADKLVGDAAVFVDWANQQTRVRDSHLWDYLSKKAGISVGDLFDSLPKSVAVGTRSTHGARSIDSVGYLFSSTRATPREMTMVMRQLQEVVPRGGQITGERVRLAVDNFASRDLLSILNAESAGILSEDLRDRMAGVLSALPSAKRVTRADLRKSTIEAELSADDADVLAEFLFMSGLLGNLNDQNDYVQFYYRRDTYAFRREGPWTLHRGLMYAYNVPW